jgi:hypothetical protein
MFTAYTPRGFSRTTLGLYGAPYPEQTHIHYAYAYTPDGFNFKQYIASLWSNNTAPMRLRNIRNSLSPKKSSTVTESILGYPALLMYVTGITLYLLYHINLSYAWRRLYVT